MELITQRSLQKDSLNSHLTPDEQMRWQQIYDDELKRPNWIHCKSDADKQRAERSAKMAADIAIGKTVWRIG